MGQIHNRLRSKSTEPLQMAEMNLISTEDIIVEPYEMDIEVAKLPLRCKAHNQEAACLCITPGCQEDPVICPNLQCGEKIHNHQLPKFMDIGEFSKLYTIRCNVYTALKSHYLKKLNNNYELFAKCFPQLQEQITLDFKDLKGLFDYCDHYEDDTWKILNGKIQDASRDELIAFIQKQPNKLFEDRFSLFRNKLLRRESAFNGNTIKTSFLKLREEVIRKKKIQEQLKKKDSETPVIKQTKLDAIIERLEEMKDRPRYLIIATMVILGFYFRMYMCGQLQNSNLNLNKFAECFRNPNMSDLQQLTIYSNWYIDTIPEYQVLTNTWMKMNNLEDVTIITRHLIKDDESFLKLKTKIQIFSEEWNYEQI